jgi:hypothetical protein
MTWNQERDMPRLLELSGKQDAGSLTAEETWEYRALCAWQDAYVHNLHRSIYDGYLQGDGILSYGRQGGPMMHYVVIDGHQAGIWSKLRWARQDLRGHLRRRKLEWRRA